MKITEVRMSKLNTENRLRAIASITLDEEFVVHGIKVIEGDNGLFMAMPSRKLKNGTFLDTAHPINNDFREKLEKTVLETYEELNNK
jgi:stage V sporulation protein G